MRITQIGTITLGEFPNLLFIEIHTDAGLTVLGETFFGAPEVATYIHASAAPRLPGADASTIDALRVGLKAYLDATRWSSWTACSSSTPRCGRRPW